jgi:two-component system NarL family response regulator
MRVLLVDDHALLLEGLQNLLEAHGVEIAGTAPDGRHAVIEARRLRPDVILMDVRMPVCDGLTATRIIKSEIPETKVIILTTSTEDEDLFEAIRAGAAGYLLKSMDADSLIEALQDVEQDIPPFAPGLAARLLGEFARSAGPTLPDDPADPVEPSPAAADQSPAAAHQPSAAAEQPSAPAASPADDDEDTLSPRQTEILTLVAQGLSYKEVGARVYLSPRTVKYHMAEIMRKLHVRNKAQVLARVGGMISRGELGDCR